MAKIVAIVGTAASMTLLVMLASLGLHSLHSGYAPSRADLIQTAVFGAGAALVVAISLGVSIGDVRRGEGGELFAKLMLAAGAAGALLGVVIGHAMTTADERQDAQMETSTCRDAIGRDASDDLLARCRPLVVACVNEQRDWTDEQLLKYARSPDALAEADAEDIGFLPRVGAIRLCTRQKARAAGIAPQR